MIAGGSKNTWTEFTGRSRLENDAKVDLGFYFARCPRPARSLQRNCGRMEVWELRLID